MTLSTSFETAGIGHNNPPAPVVASAADAGFDIVRQGKRDILASAVSQVGADGMAITASGRYIDVKSTRFTAAPNPVIR